MLKTLTGSIAAGILIALGGSAFLASDNRVVGAVLFSVALLCICYLGYYLYTGKIAYLSEDCSAKNLSFLAIGLLGNLATAYLIGILIRETLPTLGERAATICASKLEETFLNTLIRAIFCGILIYLSVQIFKEKKTPIGILFCIPVFILCGFEHSIADMFYFGASGIVDAKILWFQIATVLGNSVGGLILPILSKAGDSFVKKAD